MTEEMLKDMAKQLRKPEGEFAIQVGENLNQGNSILNLNTIDALELQNNDNVFEIGMSNGFFVKDIFAKNNSISYTGCDYSDVMVNQAIKNNESLIKSGQAQFYLACADNLPFENNIFDKVFSVNTIYFWDDHSKVLAEICRVLKRNGKLILSLRPKSSMKFYPFVKYGFDMFTKNELKYLLTDNGFKINTFLERTEPDQEVNGVNMRVDSLIVCAEKQ